MSDDPITRARDALARAAAEAAARQAVKQAGEAVGQAADSFADALEAALLGKKGAADEILAQPDVDPLDRVRATWAKATAPPPAEAPKATAEDKLAKARAELDAMKKALRKG